MSTITDGTWSIVDYSAWIEENFIQVSVLNAKWLSTWCMITMYDKVKRQGQSMLKMGYVVLSAYDSAADFQFMLGGIRWFSQPCADHQRLVIGW